MLNLSPTQGNLIAIRAEVTYYLASKGRALTGGQHGQLLDDLYYGGNVIETLKRYLDEDFHMALRKPVAEMTKAELESEWDFVHGDGKKFVSIVHAREAVQALVNHGQLMTHEQYEAMVKRMKTDKPLPSEAPVKVPDKFLSGIAPTVDEVEGGNEGTVLEGSLKMIDVRDVKGRIAGKYSKKNMFKPPVAEKKVVVKAVAEKPASGVIEILSVEDIGAGDQIGAYMAEQETVDHIIKENRLEGQVNLDAPNMGIKKMRVTNKLRSIVRNGGGIRINSVVFRLVAGAIEEHKNRKKKR